MTFQPGATVYTQSFGSRPENVEVPHYDVRAPTPTDILYPQGKRWINTVGDAEYVLTSFSTSGNITTANWVLLGTAGGALNTLTGDSGGAISPTAGNINLSGTGSQITTTGSGSTITFALAGPYTPATYTAHGVLIGEGSSSIAATAAGTNGQVLIGSTGADPAFATISSSGSTLTLTGGAHTLNIDVTAPLNVAHGGTGATTLTGVLTGNGTSAVTANTVTNHGVLLGGASNAVSSLAAAATGTLLAGSTGADPAFTASPSVTGSVTAGTSITATLGNITATNGNVVLGTAGNKLNSTSVASTTTAGANSFGTVALVAGSAVVATSAVTASSMVFLTCQDLGTVIIPSALCVSAKVASTSFTITASDATDTSTVAWFIVN